MPSNMWAAGRLATIYPVEISNDVPGCNSQEWRDENSTPSFSDLKVLTLNESKESKNKRAYLCAEVYRFWVN